MTFKKKLNKRKIFRTIWFSFGSIFMIWQYTTLLSRGLPNGTFSDSEFVSVIETRHEIVFTSKLSQNTSEVIFFQGGMTDPKAYAPLCREIAKAGFTCHLIKMKWRMPKGDYQKISNMFDLKSGNYIIGGHSQGGKMAAQFVYENPELMKGLFLMGTSHPRDINMANLAIPTLKLYAEYDGLASVGEVMENKHLLPKASKLMLIEGANHSQFGYLGRLLMDDRPNISLQQQQEQSLIHLLNHFKEIENRL